MQEKASFKSRTESFAMSGHSGQQTIRVGHHRMNVLDNVIDGPKTLYKSLFIRVRMFD